MLRAPDLKKEALFAMGYSGFKAQNRAFVNACGSL